MYNWPKEWRISYIKQWLVFGPEIAALTIFYYIISIINVKSINLYILVWGYNVKTVELGGEELIKQLRPDHWGAACDSPNNLL